MNVINLLENEVQIFFMARFQYGANLSRSYVCVIGQSNAQRIYLSLSQNFIFHEADIL